jgi:DNA-binding FrmR family transcriptional regulator
MVTAEVEKQAINRLEKVRGQVRGIRKMVEDRRYCVDILTQIDAVRAALAGVSKVILRNHIETCVATALGSGREGERRQKIAELMSIYGRFCNGR